MNKNLSKLGKIKWLKHQGYGVASIQNKDGSSLFLETWGGYY